MINYCKKCLFPETKPDLSFDEQGICSACIAAGEKDKGIDWNKRENEFYEIISHYKKKDGEIGWDCIIPVSGGKDSTYQAYFMKEICGMNPLCVCFETTAVTELGSNNLDNLSKMGMDVIHFKKNNEVYKKMVIESFKRGPNIESVKSRVLNRRWLEEFGGLLGHRIQDMIGVDGITEKELTPYFYPSDEVIEKVGVTGIFLGSYFFWDARKQLEIIKNYGFKVKKDGPTEGTYTNYENIDEKLVSLHDYLKYVKYGFGRCTDHANIDIRNKRITREQGLELIKRFDGKYPHFGVKSFIEYSGM
jgi:hypothetical protein